MSRSGYSDECENVGLWQGAVQSAIRGSRGQALLHEMADALDAMPVKELISGDIVRDNEHVCAFGAVALARQMNLSSLESDGDSMGETFGVARALACEIAYQNDECGPPKETPGERWKRMRAWVVASLR